MSIHFHKLKIKDVRQETDECISLSFLVPSALQNSFSFLQGQNITIRKEINGEEVRRSYSICTAPHQNELRIAVKKVENGLFSAFAHREFKAGDEIEVLPPTGKFYTSLDAVNRKKYLAFAAGSGITPLISVIKATLHAEPFSQFTLVNINRSRNSIIFLEELEDLKNKYIHRFILINILSREKTDAPINSGRLDNQKLNELNKLVDYAKMDEVFICGPEEMIFMIQEFFIKRGLAENQIHFELFNTVTTKKAVTSTAHVPDSKLTSKITIKLDGRSFDFDLAYDGATVLDAALKQGADLPYACKGGVCASCRAKITEGEVEMDMNWALEPEELEEHFILTCQSHPKTARVVIDFDTR